MGVSSDNGSAATFMTLRILTGGRPIRWPISSAVGSRPNSCNRVREVFTSLLIVSAMCTGMRMVRPWSAMARVTA